MQQQQQQMHKIEGCNEFQLQSTADYVELRGVKIKRTMQSLTMINGMYKDINEIVD